MISEKRVRKMLESAIKESGSQYSFAEQIGSSQSFVCQVLSGERKPSQVILEFFGLERVVMYRKKEKQNG